ncbi:PREDICTED: pupal cuticle protein-like [Nicrophorus vespilloides]|uniref:Pupal cuticle protein-like n=1 Tax=Nicrophorus vespilloides TaxID=110193 RepID=A0ABM1NJH7_NICVS|nr:PREDICTED: pupal cuticle protein-like [Nicrophorus vespilloides]
MRVLILSCLLAAAVSAGYAPQGFGGPQHGYGGQQAVGYSGPQHFPVIQNGVPVETEEVQHAKANHYAALAQEQSHPAYQHGPQFQENYEQGPAAGHGAPSYSAGPAHSFSNGQHFAPAPQSYAPAPQSYAPAPQSYSPAPQSYAPVQSFGPSHGGFAPQGKVAVAPAYETTHVIPSIGQDGKPLDTPEVQAAKAHHFAAVSEALARAPKVQPGPQGHQGPAHYRYRRGIYSHIPLAYAGPHHIPVLSHKGVPVDTVEVQHARAQHFAAHAEANHGSGYAIHQNHAPVYGYKDSYGYVPTIAHDGTPLDTPEVEHAKAAHFAAHHEALARNSKHLQPSYNHYYH